MTNPPTEYAPITSAEFNDGAGDDADARARDYEARSGAGAADADELSPPDFTDVDPVDLWGHFEPPVLPRGLLPEAIEDFARVEGDMMGADPSGLAMSALVACAAVIKDRIRVQVKRHDPSWTESARIWVALIGDPSTKKSPILSKAVRPLVRIDRLLFDQFTTAKNAFDALPKDERASAPLPKQVRLRIEDTTIEAAQEVLRDSPDGVLCLQDELSGWFGSMDKYAGNRGAAKDRSFWLQSFNGGAYAVNRVGRGAGLIENLSVCMLGGIQPDPIRKLAGEAVDDGLLQRLFAIILRPATLGHDEPVADVLRSYGDLVERLHELAPPGVDGDRTLYFDDEAQVIRRELERHHLALMATECINKKLAAHVGKLDGLFARLCVIWHCIENAETGLLPERIPADIAKRVAAFMDRFLLRHAFAFYAGTLGLADDHDHLTAVAGHILAHGLKVVTNRDIQRGDRTMRKLDRHSTQRIFEQLDTLGWVTETPGRRATDPPRWAVNPAVHTRFKERARNERERRQSVKKVIAGMRG